MPDPTFATLSASQIPELLGLSSWGTRLTLYHQFQRRVYEERKQFGRMRLGKILEPIIVELVAERLVLEVRHNAKAEYHRHPELPLGCTADATVLCPTRGFGIVETKAVDKWEFAKSWTEKSAPRMYEAQLQEQMMIPHPEHGLPAWGILAPYVYNDGDEGRLELYERRPIASAAERIAAEAKAFFADLAAGKAPPAFGLPVELGIVSEQFPEVDEARVIEAEDNYDMAEFARLYAWTAEQAKAFARTESEMKPKLAQFLEDAAVAKLAAGVRVKSRKTQMAGQVAMLPADLRRRLRKIGEHLLGLDSQSGEGLAIMEAAEWCQILKRPGTQTRLEVVEVADLAERKNDDLTPIEAG